MAREVEITRLVARLVGDNSQFKRVARETNRIVEGTRRIFGTMTESARKFGRTLGTQAQQGLASFNNSTSQLRKVLSQAGTQIKRTTTQLTEMGTAAKIALAGATAAGGAYLRRSMNAAGQREQTQIAFGTLLGDPEKTRKTLADLKQFAAETPFEMTEINVAARGLITFGETGEDLIETLTLLGNAASATSSDFGMISLIFNQVRGVGKLLTQDFRQLSTRGVLFLTDIAEHFGVTEKEANAMISTGKVGFEDLKDILRGLSSEGGRFADMMKVQSQSFLGLKSTISDNLTFLSQEIGQQYLTVAKEVQRATIYFLEQFRQAPDSVKATIASVVGLAAAVGSLSTAWAFLGSRIMAAIGIMKSAALAAKALAVSFAPLLIGGAIALGIVALQRHLSGVGDQLDLIRKQAEQFTAVMSEMDTQLNRRLGRAPTSQHSSIIGDQIETMAAQMETATLALQKQVQILNEMERMSQRTTGGGGSLMKSGLESIGLDIDFLDQSDVVEAQIKKYRDQVNQLADSIRNLRGRQEELNAAPEIAKAKKIEDLEKYLSVLKETIAFENQRNKPGGLQDQKLFGFAQAGADPKKIQEVLRLQEQLSRIEAKRQARDKEKAERDKAIADKKIETERKIAEQQGKAEQYLQGTLNKYQRLGKEIRQINMLQSQGFLTGRQANNVILDMLSKLKGNMSDQSQTFLPAFGKNLQNLRGLEFGRGSIGLARQNIAFRRQQFQRQGFSRAAAANIVNNESRQQRMNDNQKLLNAIGRVEQAIRDGQNRVAIGILDNLEE